MKSWKAISIAILAGACAGLAQAQNAGPNTAGPTRNDYRLHVVQPAEGATITGDALQVVVDTEIPAERDTRQDVNSMPRPDIDVFIDDQYRETMRDERNVVNVEGLKPGPHTIVAPGVEPEPRDHRPEGNPHRDARPAAGSPRREASGRTGARAGLRAAAPAAGAARSRHRRAAAQDGHGGSASRRRWPRPSRGRPGDPASRLVGHSSRCGRDRRGRTVGSGRSRTMRRFLSPGNALTLAGALLLAGPAAHVVTGLRAQAARPPVSTASVHRAHRVHRAADGEAVGRLELPRLGVDLVVFEGVSDSTLRKGPGASSRNVVAGSGRHGGQLRHRGPSRLVLSAPGGCPPGRSGSLPGPVGNFDLSARRIPNRAARGRVRHRAEPGRPAHVDHLLPVHLDRLGPVPARLDGRSDRPRPTGRERSNLATLTGGIPSLIVSRGGRE